MTTVGFGRWHQELGRPGHQAGQRDADAIPGWKLELAAEDDEAKPDVGKNAATKLAGDDEVIGVVGTLNSSVSQSLQPVLNSANIVEISPANTGTSVTMGPDPANPKRAYPNYFRTCTNDAVQGPFAGRYLYEQGYKKIATIHDKKTYGQGLAGFVTEAYKGAGGEIVAAETINPEDTDFSAVISRVKAAKPEAVFYGGEYPQAGPLSQQAKSAGLTVPLMGGDGIFDPVYIELAGKTSEGDLATSVGAPTDDRSIRPSSSSATTRLPASRSLTRRTGHTPMTRRTRSSMRLKTSLASASDAKSARAATIDAVGKVSFDGANGKVEFDEFGDTTNKVITAYEVKDGKWVAVKTGNLSR